MADDRPGDEVGGQPLVTKGIQPPPPEPDGHVSVHPALQTQDLLRVTVRHGKPVRVRVALPQCFKPEQGRTTHTSNPFHVEALCPVPLRLAPTTGTLSPWALLPVGDPVVVCQVRSTFRASVRPLPRLIVGCVLPEDHEVRSTHPVRQESGYQRLSRRCRNAPTGTGVQAIQPCPCVA